MTALGAPLAVMAELTHRCPLQCPYCSNPLELLKAGAERDTAFWLGVIDEAASLGVLQIHFSGGEPALRPDLATLVERATMRGLYANLITSAVTLDEAKLRALAAAGLAHVQISFQGALPASADRIGNYKGGHVKKLQAARLVTELGMSLTVNAVVHRQNLQELPAMIDMAVALDADRLEVAHVQYHGWALKNRAALMPDREAFASADRIVLQKRSESRGRMIIDYVVPDYYASTPKTCMGGWGQKTMNITPDGRVLPCHAAETIPDLAFDKAGDNTLKKIWFESAAFQAFRGTAWMREPCASCDLKDVDFGGCRCQALALAGDARATDPGCHLSPLHRRILDMAESESRANQQDFVYRRI